jgi:pyrroloquinoline quinone biosynthesis protein D
MRATTISGSAQPRLTNGARVQTDSVTGKSVLLYPEGIIELNETAHEILSRCDGRTLDEIVQALAKQYDVNFEALAADVRDTLSDLQRRRLIKVT